MRNTDQRVIRFPVCLFSLALCGLFLFLLSNAVRAQGITVDRVLATVGGEIITLAEYKEFVRIIKGYAGDEVDEMLLRQLMEERMIVQEAKRKGLEASDAEVENLVEEFKTKNNWSQADLDAFLRGEAAGIKDYRQILRGRVLRSKIVSSDVDSKVIVREKELEDYYLLNQREFLSGPEKVEVKAIFLRLREDASVTEITDLKRRALRIVGLVRDGYNFDGLIVDYCDEPLKGQGGLLGKFARGGLIPPLDEKAFSMKPGEVSEPIWVTEGVYVIYLANRQGETYKALSEAKDEISDKLRRMKRDKIYNEWVKALWEKTSITINQS